MVKRICRRQLSGKNSVQGSGSEKPTSQPKPTLSIMYFNARSVLSKLDDLRLMCTLEKPDVVCIVETWLCSDITNNEIAIPEYTVHRLDRNRHGGGILIYCHCHLNIRDRVYCQKIHSIATYFSLEQVVSSPTHFSHAGNPSLIDLLFISCPDRLLSCITVPPLVVLTT